ncbi:Hypothetical predicted protein [Podarcis lilfordi]|uniref:Secreted protein n=1 Tax=Podarcis lilfordi TaxID=74358 RepID=A0AA35KWC3_9SAUR|nr:Hypothetical predicted protein [Podarcis lilfordi]
MPCLLHMLSVFALLRQAPKHHCPAIVLPSRSPDSGQMGGQNAGIQYYSSQQHNWIPSSAPATTKHVFTTLVSTATVGAATIQQLDLIPKGTLLHWLPRQTDANKILSL